MLKKTYLLANSLQGWIVKLIIPGFESHHSRE